MEVIAVVPLNKTVNLTHFSHREAVSMRFMSWEGTSQRGVCRGCIPICILKVQYVVFGDKLYKCFFIM